MSEPKYPKLWETESIVIEFLEKLIAYKKGDNTEEELEDTDLGWELSHIEHTIDYINQERGKID